MYMLSNRISVIHVQASFKDTRVSYVLFGTPYLPDELSMIFVMRSLGNVEGSIAHIFYSQVSSCGNENRYFIFPSIFFSLTCSHIVVFLFSFPSLSPYILVLISTPTLIFHPLSTLILSSPTHCSSASQSHSLLAVFILSVRSDREVDVPCF